MKILNKILFAFFVSATFFSCKKQGEVFENKVFILADNFKNEVRVATDEGGKTMERSLKIGIAQPIKSNLKVEFVKSPELLTTYRNAYYDKEALLLPDANCDVSGLKGEIRAGDIISGAVKLSFKDLDKLDYKKSYVLPVTINTNGPDVLPRAKTMYFVVKEASLVNYVADLKTNCAWPIWDGFAKVKDLETFTMEALINCHSFKNTDGKIQTIMGVEDHFLIRISDTTIPENQIQVACAVKDTGLGTVYRGSVSASAMQLRTDRWYHLAVTFDKGKIKVYIDGKMRAEDDLSIIATRINKDTNLEEKVYYNKVDFSAPHSDEMEGKPRCFWVGYSYDNKRSFNGMIAEARVWNKVLTKEEINKPNHFYKLYPNEIDNSLLAYWKFSEGAGKVIKDYSVYGKDLTADHDPVWYPVELPAKSKN